MESSAKAMGMSMIHNGFSFGTYWGWIDYDTDWSDYLESLDDIQGTL